MYEDSHLESDIDDRWGAPDPLDDWPILNYSDVLDREAEWDRRNMEDEEDYRGESDMPDDSPQFPPFDPNRHEDDQTSSFQDERDEFRRALQTAQFGYLI